MDYTERIEIQEQIDFIITKQILSNVYGSQLKGIERRKGYTATDVLYTATSLSNSDKVSLEIKNIKNSCYKLKGTLFKFDKYVNMKVDRCERDNSERLLAIFLCDVDRQYYIIDFDELPINKLEVSKIRLNKTQFNPSAGKVTESVFYIPLEEYSICSGHYTIPDEAKELINKLEKP